MVDAPPSGETVQSKGSRTRAGIALAIAIISILGIIFAAKIYQDSQAAKPVAISNPELPANDSPECAELLDRLPERAAGLVRAEITEPAPEGAAVYRNLEQDRITLRCGANVPSQYNELAKTEEVKGISWLRVVDSTDESLATWFTVGREPVVAITAEGNAKAEDALRDLAEALRPDSEYKNKPERGGVPLAELAAPEYGTATSFAEAREVASSIGYPVLVRPSYVLGGRGMEIVYDEKALEDYIERATELSPDHPVLVDRFLDSAIEIDVDALCDGNEVYLGGVMEHIEEAGIHSGDSGCALPLSLIHI